jgi:hypothetical protein
MFHAAFTIKAIVSLKSIKRDVFPVRYKLNFNILFRIHSLFEMLIKLWSLKRILMLLHTYRNLSACLDKLFSLFHYLHSKTDRVSLKSANPFVLKLK